MTADVPENPAQNNSNVPAGFTYLGQFIDHDITRDETEGFPPINDPQLIKQGRSVTLDLDSLYGQGPKRQPGLYNPDFPPERARFQARHDDSGDWWTSELQCALDSTQRPPAEA
jgi:hypothetical protein